MRKRIQDGASSREGKRQDQGTDRRRPENRGPKTGGTLKGKPFGKNDPFKKDGFKPRESTERSGFKPRDTERKPFGSDNRRDDKREGGFQPREPRSFDRKPFGSDSRRDDKREGGFQPKPPRSSDRTSFGSDKRDGGFKPRESGSFEKKPFENRSFDKPASREYTDQKTEKPTGKPAFFKGKARERSEESEKQLEARREKLSENRQTGLSHAPRYDEDRMKKQLPPKILKKVDKDEKDDTIRLNRYIANAGLCSRREADEFISSGQITVNGKVITEMGYKVQPADVVKYGRKILNREKIVYVLLNKPKDFITTTEDPEDRKTVMELVAKACDERIYPVGRLDRMTTGLLLLTNDGELADKLSHPSNGIKKVYQVELDKKITQEHFDMILQGIELEDGQVKADDLSIITPDGEVVGIEIHSGKNRIVRRIFEHLGYEVLKLDRTTYAGLTKKDLPRGKWRFLTEKEVIRLKYMI